MAAMCFRNRLSACLTPHPVGRGASLPGHYAASSLLPPPPTPGDAAIVVMHSDHHVRVRPEHTGPLRFHHFSVATRRLSLPRASWHLVGSFPIGSAVFRSA